MAGGALPACLACVGGLLLLLVTCSFTMMAPTEMALKYNFVTKTVSPEVVVDPGLLFVGPFTSLIRYPKTIQPVQYDAEDRALLDGRTKDGLPLILGLSFQYRLLPDGLYHLYHTFESSIGAYEELYKLVGIHMLTEIATQFTAYQFFNEKQKIAQVMKTQLDEYFMKHLFATVESLQINEDDLPEAFTETILTAATSKQNITRMEKTRDASIVNFRTAVLVSLAQANVTVQKAVGDQHRIIQNGKADAAIIEAYVQAELEAYSRIHTDLGLEGEDLIQYIWYDSLGGGGVAANAHEEKDVELLIGVNPSAYISQQGP